MSRNAALLAAVVLMATACERNKTPDLDRGDGAPVPTAASPATSASDPGGSAKPADTTNSGSATSKPRVAGANVAGSAASTRARRPSGKSLSDDPCAGLDGVELDDCLGFDPNQSNEDTAGPDFSDRQRQRDRALLEREAAEQAAVGDEPPTDADEDPYDPQDELPPGDAYDDGVDDGYDPGDDEPPPDDDGG